jgi:uncharacterized protein
VTSFIKIDQRRGLLAALLFLLACFAGGGAVQADGPTTPLVVSTASGTEYVFEVELALTDKQRGLGLMYRTELAPNKGMLFIFKDKRQMAFWMHNVEIPLDIIFLNPDGSILNIVANAAPHTDTQRLSKGPAKAVFEIIGGRAAELGLMPGDVVRHALLGNMKATNSNGP